MNPNSILILAATATASLRTIALCRRSRDGRWNMQQRRSAPLSTTAPYRANPTPSRLVIGARGPLVIVVWLGTFLSALVTSLALLPMVESVCLQFQQGNSFFLVWTLYQADRSPFVPWIALENSPDLPIDFFGYLVGWFVAAFLLWRSGHLVLRTSTRESTRSILAAVLTMALTVAAWIQDQTNTSWPNRWESEPILAVALAISLCLLFVAVVARSAVENGTVIGDPNSIVARRPAAH